MSISYRIFIFMILLALKTMILIKMRFLIDKCKCKNSHFMICKEISYVAKIKRILWKKKIKWGNIGRCFIKVNMKMMQKMEKRKRYHLSRYLKKKIKNWKCNWKKSWINKINQVRFHLKVQVNKRTIRLIGWNSQNQTIKLTLQCKLNSWFVKTNKSIISMVAGQTDSC